MTPTPLHVSVIVTTRNRANDLRRLLPSLLQLTYPALEVVIVVGPSDDDTAVVVDAYRDRMKIVASPAANMCLSRNLGVAAAAGDVVVFVDDDAMPATRAWIDDIVEPFARDAQVAAAGGPVRFRDGDGYQFRHGAVSEYGEHVFVVEPGTPLPTLGARWFARAMGTNAAFRRSALIAVGGFDERIAYYGDECDVCARLALAGHRFAWVDAAAVRHYPAPSVHRHLIDRTQILSHDDSYFCLRTAQGPWLMRLWTTLRKAPNKHYVAEVLAARRAGTVRGPAFLRFCASWLRGAAAAALETAFTPRPRMGPVPPPPPFLALARELPARRRTIVLLTRQLACDGPCEGPARYTFDLAVALHALGHEVHVIGESPSPRRFHRLGFVVHGIAAGEIARHPIPSYPIVDGNVAYALAVGERVATLAQSGVVPDVVHATNWNFEALGVLLSGKVPVVMMLVTSLAEVIAYEHWDTNDDLRAGLWLDRAQIHAAQALVAPSRGLVEAYLTSGVIDASTAASVTPTPLGIVPQPTRPEPAARPRRLLFVGTHVRRKGLDDLLAVLPRLLSDFPTWSCDIVGDDSRIVEDGLTLRHRFNRAHAGADWLARVVFHGRVADDALWTFYRSAAVYVVPSRFESFGLTYLEAMQFGVPVVAARVGGVPEVVADGVTGILVPVGDRQALIDALAGLLRDDTLRSRMGRAARDEVQSRWTHIHMARRLLPIYEAAVRDGVRPTVVGQAAAGQAVVDMIGRAGAPSDLVDRLRRSLAYEASDAERHVIVNAATGRLPSPTLYVGAVEASVERGEIDRAARLLDDAHSLGGPLDDMTLATLSSLARLVRHLQSPPASTLGTLSELASAVDPDTLDDALGVLRGGRVVAGMSALLRIAESPGGDAVARLSAIYHLGSAMKRCGYLPHAAARFAGLTACGQFTTLDHSLQAATWFHTGDLANGAGRLDDAHLAFATCLALNPLHGKASAMQAAVRAELAGRGSTR